MSINLNDWFGTHLFWLWLVLAMLLAVLELLRRDTTMLLVAVGAVAAAVTALVVKQAWYVQIAVFVVVAAVAVLVGRLRSGTAS